jgi:hypothetical protein
MYCTAWGRKYEQDHRGDHVARFDIVKSKQSAQVNQWKNQ